MTTSSFLNLDPTALSPHDIYRLLIGTVVPRPIAIVSTQSPSGLNNLAPFSFFNAVSASPALLMIAVSRKENGERKDTHRNIEETGEFVVNTADVALLDPLVHAAASYPYGVSEFEKVGLSALPSVKIKPPRVAESPAQFECKVFKLIELGDSGPGSSTMILGEVVQIHLRANLYHEGKIAQGNLEPLARLGGISYAELGERYEKPIPQIK